jgi:hypothetical protein
MKQFLAVACLSVLALVVMSSGQVIMSPTGLAIKGGQALAAELPPPPPPAPVGKGKAPWFVGKGKAPPPPHYVTK